ncbi:dihydrolipoamide acetyltransferase family protein [Chitinispirillales bacterium ANBcel5]|uniref:dihydrolipoamide acetyltransferase family protein n=1 Tax=Cellulosispirillum alkaliphilum TaxID=3039283 RepID=UPI002A517428|nr:dihydrolipoamide acetyltransferase family protein [Chitinispirillales bacterium ANBcel5]
MAEKLVMLALSPTMEIATVAKWIKQQGEAFSAGDVLCEVETDKATMDYEANSDGTILKIIAGEGARVKVGEVIAIAGSPGEDISALLKQIEGEQEKEAEPEGAIREQAEIDGVHKQSKGDGKQKPPKGVKASPLARELAKKNSIDITTVHGTGPQGRVIKQDIERRIKEKEAASTAPVTSSAMREEKIPHSERRRVIAQRLSQSMFTAPHFYLSVNVCADLIVEARRNLNAKRDQKISLNAFLIKLVAEALRQYPQVNSTWQDDAIRHFGAVDIGLAVAVKDGLVTPVVRNCTSKGILTIDEELRGLVEKARKGKLSLEDYTNATFTISNLGSYGVRHFTAIINPPGSAILAVGEVFKEPVVAQNKDIEVQSTIILTLSCDHRVVDGALAAEFAATLKEVFENPVSMLF